MHLWKGYLTHALILLAQPTYLALRYLINAQYFQSISTTWIAIHAVTWIYILTRRTIPFYTSPFLHLPYPQTDRLFLGHFRPFGEKLPVDRIANLYKVPNDGVIVLWGLLYWTAEVLPTKPNTLMEILNTNNYDWEKHVLGKRILSRVTGEGLINTEGNDHKVMRRVIAPAFSGRNMRDLVPMFYSKGLAFADSMAREAQQTTDGVLEMMHQMSRVTLDIIGAAGVGKDFNTIENDDNSLARLYATITDTNRGNIFIFFMINALVPESIVKRMKGTLYARVAKANIQLRADARVLMQEKKQMMMEKSEQQRDIIATVMRSGDFSDDYLVNQLLTFLAAGHDTTASALTWTVYLLAVDHRIQDRLRAECNARLAQKPESEIDSSLFDTESMPYLTAVCNETLRLYPTVPFTGRHAVRPTTVGPLHVPIGTSCLISPWAINRSPELWGADADKYNPDRWLTGPNAANGGAASPYSLITFLHGPRSCIGQTFARIEMKCLLAALVMRSRFELIEPNQQVEVAGFITIKPYKGLKLKIHDLKA